MRIKPGQKPVPIAILLADQRLVALGEACARLSATSSTCRGVLFGFPFLVAADDIAPASDRRFPDRQFGLAFLSAG